MAQKNNIPATEAGYQAWIENHKNQLAEWRKDESIPDHKNPAYIFSGTASSLLSKIARGEISAQFLARAILADRGQDINGTWIGFKQAASENFK
jgi:hypothetical protein